MTVYKKCGFQRQSRYHIFQFLRENSMISDKPLRLATLAELYHKHYKHTGDPNTITKSFYDICRRLSACQNFKMMRLSFETKVKMTFVMSANVDPLMEIELKKNGTYELDEARRIIKYTSNDRTFRVQGNHRLQDKQVPTRLTTVFGDFGSPFDDEEDGESDTEEVRNGISLPSTSNHVRKTEPSNGAPVPKKSRCFADSSTRSASPARGEAQMSRTTPNFPFSALNQHVEWGQQPMNGLAATEHVEAPINISGSRTPKQESIEENMQIYGNDVYHVQPAEENKFKENSLIEVDVVRILRTLKTITRVLSFPMLNLLLNRINKKILHLENLNVKIPIQIFATAIHTAVDLMTRSQVTHTPEESYTSLKEVLVIIQTATSEYEFEELQVFNDFLSSQKLLYSSNDVMIPVERIQDSLGYALQYIL